MSDILVVCGAGASSTFLVHWMRKAASGHGLDLSIDAANAADLRSGSVSAPVVLVGSHLAPLFSGIHADVASAGGTSVLLPAVTFDAAGAEIALALALECTALATTPTMNPTGSTTNA